METVFKTLNAIDVSQKVKEKNKLAYLPWASAWCEVKKIYPDAVYIIHKQIIDEFGNKRPWFTDGKTGWVETTVTINGESQTETLAIMNFKNQSIPADEITSFDANKSIKRCLVKTLALHGLGLYIYEGEELPEEISKVKELQDSLKELVKKKCALSDKAKEKVAELCKKAELEANPDAQEDSLTGNPHNIEDFEILTKLKKQLLAVRK